MVQSNQKLIFGNWKMNGSLEKWAQFSKTVFAQLNKNNIDLGRSVLFLPDLLLHQALQNNELLVGAQNHYFEDAGAFTGETSPELLSNIGIKYALIGHSERRHVFGESIEMISQKMKAAQRNSIKPVLCIGETLEQREANKVFDTLKNQLVSLTSQGAVGECIVAYEPVWAIGTGKVASLEQIEEVHQFLKENLKNELGVDVKLLYGGSVKPNNVKEILNIESVDGCLVGGASLTAESYLALFGL